jgi:hypothetical protein
MRAGDVLNGAKRLSQDGTIRRLQPQTGLRLTFDSLHVHENKLAGLLEGIQVMHAIFSDLKMTKFHSVGSLWRFAFCKISHFPTGTSLGALCTLHFLVCGVRCPHSTYQGASRALLATPRVRGYLLLEPSNCQKFTLGENLTGGIFDKDLPRRPPGG